MIWFALVSAVIAGLATWLELDRTFYVPKQRRRKLALWGWWWGFVSFNGILAGAIYIALTKNPEWKVMAETDAILRALAVGVGYLALVHLSFSDISIGNAKVAFGPQFLYDSTKEAVYKRLNSKATDALLLESRALAQGRNLADLQQEARQRVNADNLFTADEKIGHLDWIERVVADSASSNDDRAMQLAGFILRRARPN